MSQRENESVANMLLLIVLFLLLVLAIVGVGIFGMLQYRSAIRAREDAVRMEMMAHEAVLMAEKQAIQAQEAAKEQINEPNQK